jgi:hypothetical protein
MKSERTIFSAPTYINKDIDLEFDVLEFEGMGGLIIQFNRTVKANTVITQKADMNYPQFTFTTLKPTFFEQENDINKTAAAKLYIGDLQGNLRIVNTGKPGGDGGRGGNGTDGGIVPPGSVNGLGGRGGDGANGGNGGDGGDGPDLIVKYSTAGQSSVILETKSASGGIGGEGGKGGQGGKNADKTFAECGKDGQPGENGAFGKPGRVRINTLNKTEEEKEEE